MSAMLRYIYLLIAIPIIALLALPVAGRQVLTANAEVSADYDIPNGHFFTQTNGAPAGKDFSGYGVTDENSVSFWSEWRRLGGLETLGYPISQRFSWGGFTTQAFQKGVLQWRPEARQAWLVNVFDLLHEAGKDAWLQNSRATPLPLPPNVDDGKPFGTVVRDRQAILDGNPAIKARYLGSPDPLAFYGLPASNIVDNGNHFSIRFQRAVMQQWKTDVAWAKAGQVTVANGGEIAKEAGLLPTGVFATDPPPWGAGHVIVIDPGHGGAEVGAAHRFADGTIIAEKDLNLKVSLKVADLLARAGYKPILTRKTDTNVNQPPKLVTGRPPIGLDDDLQARIDIANNAKAELFLSIHFNGHPDNRLRGSEVYYCMERTFASESRRFAGLLLTNLTQGLAGAGYPVDGAIKDDSRALKPHEHFYLLGPVDGWIVRASAMPAALAEGLFLTNPDDAKTLRAERTIDVIALAYATAVHQYFTKNTKAQLPNVILDKTTPIASSTPSAAPKTPSVAPSSTATSTPKTSATTTPTRTLTVTTTTTPAAKSATPTATTTPTPPPSKTATPAPTPTKAPTMTPSPSPTPPATITPVVKGVVAVEYGGGALLRSAPDQSASLVRALPNGDTIDLLQLVNGEAIMANDSRWYRSLYDASEGYVYAQLVQPQGTLAPSRTPPSTARTKATVDVDFGGGAILRSKPTTDSEMIAALPDGAVVDLLEIAKGEVVQGADDRWYRALYANDEGYIYSQLVKLSNTTSTAVSSSTAVSKGTVAIDAADGAFLRSNPSTSSQALLALPAGTAVDLLQISEGEVVLGVDNRWYRARYDGTVGYIYGLLVRPG